MKAVVASENVAAATWSRRLGAFALVLFLTSALSHRGGLLATVPFFYLLGLCFLLALSGLCLAVTGFVQVWQHGVAGLKAAAMGALLSLLVLSPYAASAYRLVLYPRVVDVSTDPARPPQFSRAAALRVAPMNPLPPHEGEEARSPRIDAYPALNGRRYENAGEQVVEAVGALIADRGWRLLSPIPPTGGIPSMTLEAAAHSYLLGLPADVAIRVEERWSTTYVDMRSVSRYGRHDLGDNALRIERFLNDLDQRLETLGTQ